MKNLGNINVDVFEILRFALDDNVMSDVFYCAKWLEVVRCCDEQFSGQSRDN